MNSSNLSDNLTINEDDKQCNYLINSNVPDISLPNQDGNLLKLSRLDTFYLILYFYPMTGNPNKQLPENWDSIPGAKGCTQEMCSFRDNYFEFTKLNSIPIGISSQSVKDINEMTNRLHIHHDILSDEKLLLTKKLKLPTFQTANKTYIKRLTMIIKESTIKHIFYPILHPDLHFKDVIKWLEDKND